MLVEVGLEAITSGVQLERYIGQPGGGNLERLTDLTGPLVRNICHANAERYFEFSR